MFQQEPEFQKYQFKNGDLKMNKIAIKQWDQIEDRKPEYALIADVDLVIVRFDEQGAKTGIAYGCVSKF